MGSERLSVGSGRLSGWVGDMDISGWWVGQMGRKVRWVGSRSGGYVV